MLRLRTLVPLVLVMVTLGSVGSTPTGAATPIPGPPTTPLSFAGDRVPAEAWTSATDDYLEWAVSQPIGNGDVMGMLAHAEHARRTGGTWDAAGQTVEDFAGTFQALRDFKDTNDFRINSLLQLYVGYGDELDPDLRDAIEERLLAFKYWYTEPTPPGIVDSQYYWTENHLVVFLADEMIAGEQLPDAVFTNSGMTGREHVAHARPLIQRWFALRARYGFSEWLSNVYWMEDFMGLILLADLAQDTEIADQAAAMLDSLFVELASHLHEGAFGSTHGRSYNKDKMTARDEDTFTLAQLVFGDGDDGYQRRDRATQLAVAGRYVPPEVARQIVADDRPVTVEQRQSLPIDPSLPITPDPVGPDGLSYDDEFVWWSMGAQFPWQVVPRSIELIEAYDLLDTDNFQQVSDLRPIIESTPVPGLQALARQLNAQLNPGLLSDARTTTWRSSEAMLSSVQGWRPGRRSEQVHVWQATLDADAQVFTTHPSQPPVSGTTDWYRDTGYWTGSGSTPWTVQHENVNVSIYDPQYDDGVPLGYEPLTHAYFPTERFDEVVRQDGWTIGRKGDGYVALWSWRPTEFRIQDPATTPTAGMTEPFDLRAEGGATNVWITEVGGASSFPGAADPFAAFVAQITSAPVEAVPQDEGFAVSYTSPSQGALRTSWEEPLTLQGAELPLGTDLKWSSPWTTVPWGSMCATVEAGGARLDLDFSSLRPLITDEAAAPRPGPCLVEPEEPPVEPPEEPTPPGPAPPAGPISAPASFTG